MPTMTPVQRTLLRLARALRYRTLHEAIGRRVGVTSEASIIPNILAALGDCLPAELARSTNPAAGLPTVAKYALLDLEFRTTKIDLPRLSLGELRELGLLVRAPIAGDDIANDDFGLAQFVEEACGGNLFVKVMLDAIDDVRPIMERLQDTLRGLPRDYFPRDFRVRDACITNVSAIWLGKHFYL